MSWATMFAVCGGTSGCSGSRSALPGASAVALRRSRRLDEGLAMRGFHRTQIEPRSNDAYRKEQDRRGQDRTGQAKAKPL